MIAASKFTVHTTFNDYHLGDNLVHLNFLRRLALANPGEAFGHYAPMGHVAQLLPVIRDVPNVRLLTVRPEGAINAWRGAGGFWHGHEARLNFAAFHLDWFAHLSRQMGLESPMEDRDSLLFDYPDLKAEDVGTKPMFDYLIVNSIPHSGQFRGYNTHDFELLARLLTERGKECITTYPTGFCRSTHDGSSGLSVTGIGRLSQSARCILGVATGPIWPTFNIWNKDARRIILLDEERVELANDTVHVRNVAEVVPYLLP